jgi:hypothetical protein
MSGRRGIVPRHADCWAAASELNNGIRKGSSMKSCGTAVLLFVLSAPITATAEPFTLMSVPSPITTWAANDHDYAVVLAPLITWDAAAAATAAFAEGWQLATITSAAEQGFVGSLALSGSEFWLGGFQNPLTTVAADADWTWVTGEPFTYTNWNGATFLEPNDYYGPGTEQHLALLGSSLFLGPAGTWNDEGNPLNVSGYVLERPAQAAVPEPSSIGLTLLGLVSLGLVLRRHSARS